MCNIMQQNELFCTAKSSLTQMRPKARPIKFTNGRVRFNGKKHSFPAKNKKQIKELDFQKLTDLRQLYVTFCLSKNNIILI